MNTATPVSPPADPELEALLTRHFPQGALRVLDCAPGPPARLAAIREKGTQHIALLAGDPAGAPYDAVLDEDVYLKEPVTDQRYDFILCHGLLPRLRDPEPLLRKLHKLLASGGRLLATVPNIQHHRCVIRLIKGHWEHEEGTALARANVRFFTGSELFRLLQNTDYIVERTSSLRADGATLFPRDEKNMVRIGRIQIGPLNDDEYKQYLVRDYAFLARVQA